MNIKQIAVGDTVTYTIPASELPVDPGKQYQGIVTSIDEKNQTVKVSLISPGYEGETEPVHISRIIKVTKPEPPG